MREALDHGECDAAFVDTEDILRSDVPSPNGQIVQAPQDRLDWSDAQDRPRGRHGAHRCGTVMF